MSYPAISFPLLYFANLFYLLPHRMASIGLPRFFQGLVGSILFFTLYYVYWELTVGAPRRALIKKHGCKPIKDTAALNSFPNTICGIDILRQNFTAFKEGRFLDNIRERHHRNGNTFHGKILLTDLWSTIEPENLKTIMALNFKHWELGERRKTAFTPLMGHGIFTTDGHAWHHSRELLRPNFARSQVGDLTTFETHVDRMIKAIPRDGFTVDLQDLFFQLTMDSATEFLFGYSTDCLASGQTSDGNMRFAEAFNRSQDAISESFRSGKLGQWLRKSNFKKDVQCVHDFVDHFVYKGLEYRKTLDLSKGPPELRERERYVFMNELVKRTADPIQIRSELLNVLIAGRDTTASLLSDVWFVLARRPDIWAKLRAEVDELGGKKPTFEQIKNMKYLKRVLNECKTPCYLFLNPQLTFDFRSIASLSSRSQQHTSSRRRHSTPTRWRRGWEISTPRPQRSNDGMVNVHHAPPQGLLWSGRRRVQAREMGNFAARLGRINHRWEYQDP